MVIKSENYKPLMILVLLGGIALPVLCGYDHGAVDGIFIFGIVLYYIIVIPFWISTGRTFIMNEIGCTVKFLWYQKTYSWDELKVKRYVHTEGCFKYGRQSQKYSAEFARRELRRPKWMHPGRYCELFHPLSIIYVNFRPISIEEQKAGQYYPFFYPVNGMIFINKMNEWKIKMDAV